jgi:hypothetical protein
MQAPGIHFQHPDQPPCAATLPQTHPLKTRIAALLHALHFMLDWQQIGAEEACWAHNLIDLFMLAYCRWPARPDTHKGG